jgi:hypothetical protein
MRTWFLQRNVMTVFAGFAMVSALCGESQQEGKVSRAQPQAAVATQGPRPTRTAAPQRTMNQIPARVNRVYRYPGTRTVVPPGWVRCTSIPNMAFWRQRDITAEIQWLSRSGFIPVSPIGDRVDSLSDYAYYPAGWRAYGVSVPAGGAVQVEVQHTKLGWFRLMLVDKWGKPGPGMLEAAIAHQPVMVTYKNPNKEATAVYIIVDDPAWWSDARDPYTLVVRRDWDPATTDLSQVKMVSGLWGATPSVSAEFRRPSLTGPAVFPH